METSMVFWLTGLSGAGKSTLAQESAAILREKKLPVTILDGDIVRKGLCSDLGYSLDERRENNRRCAEVAKILAVHARQICLCSFISPTRALRQMTKAIIGETIYREIYIQCDLATCIARDPKGNYKKALDGRLKGYTGIDSPYEIPECADLCVPTDSLDIAASTKRIVDFIYAQLGLCKNSNM